MTCFTRCALFLFPLACVFAQDAGIASEWDVKTRMAAMANDGGRLEDLLRRARPQEWVEKGAPDAYFRQLESARTNMQVLIAGTEKLAKDPERLSTALEVLFRMDTMDLLLQSLQGAIRKFKVLRLPTISPALWRTIHGIATCCGNTASIWLRRAKTI